MTDSSPDRPEDWAPEARAAVTGTDSTSLRPGVSGGSVDTDEALDADDARGADGSVVEVAQPTDRGALDRAYPLDRTTALGAAVVALALAGICALLADDLLSGGLRLAAGVLAGLGIGAGVLALPGLRRRTARVIAALAAIALALALTVPAVLASRPGDLADHALAEIDAIGEGDQVVSVPREGSPVLVRRADGTGQVLRPGRVDAVDAAEGDVLALSADGAHLLHVAGDTTTVLSLDRDGAPEEVASLDGTPVALADGVLVIRACADGICRTSGHDLAAAAGVDPDGADGTGTEVPTALWTVGEAEEAHGPEPAGIDVPARRAEPLGPLDALRSGGVLPEVTLRHHPAQGWVQVDVRTGFAIGQVLARPEEDCRILPTTAPPEPGTLQEAGPVVLSVCSTDDGAMTARAHRDGLLLWESDPSPAGEWTLRADRGRVLAHGTETGADAPGEIVVGEQRAAWTAPGGETMQEVMTLTSRLGIDGGRMVVTNAAGQLVAYGTLDGTDRWALPLSSPEARVRGTLGADSAVVLDPQVRTRPLDPRDAERLRVIDVATGETTLETVVTGDVDPVAGVGSGRALVTVGESTYLLGR